MHDQRSREPPHTPVISKSRTSAARPNTRAKGILLSRALTRRASLSLVTAAALAGAACSSGNAAVSGAGGTPNSNGGATAGAAPSGGASGGGVASSGAPGSSGAGGGSITGGSGGGSSAGSGGSVQQGGSGGSGGSAGGGPQPQRPKRTADEVLVVSNSNSPTSMAIAQDYASKRNVQNVLSISCADSATSSDKETIELSDYTSSIATPIQQFLTAHTSVNFVVLTKGIPIRINGAKTGCCQGNVDNQPNGSGQPSVDSYLAAIDYPQIPDAKKIGITGSGTVGSGWLNRYWNATEPFTHAKFGGYIVTRLDGFTQADAMSLVTRALAAEQTAATSTNKILLDIDAPRGLGNKAIEPERVTTDITSEWSYDTWNADLLNAGDLLQASGIPYMLDKTDTFVGNQSNLLGYFSWGSNDSNFGQVPPAGQDPTLVSGSAAYESLTFADGSMADTAVSTSGRTFLKPFDPGGQSLMAELIARGLTCGKAYVGEPLLQGVASPSIALSRYYSGYSAAESLYAASRFTGWEDIIFGDPLGTPYAYARPPVTPIQAASFDSSSQAVKSEDCSEGGSDVGSIDANAFTAYKNVALNGAQTFAARVASAGTGGNIEIHLDSATGTLLGTCSVPVTGDYQKWVTQTCPLTDASGTHDIYLVYTGNGTALFNIEWFVFR